MKSEEFFFLLLFLAFSFSVFAGFGNGFYRSPFACVSVELSSRAVSRKVFSPLQSLTSVFGMGTGGPSAFITLTFFSRSILSLNIEQHYLTKSRLVFFSVKLHGIRSLYTVRSP